MVQHVIWMTLFGHSPTQSHTCNVPATSRGSNNYPDRGEAEARYGDQRVLRAETGPGAWFRLLASIYPSG